MSKPSHEHWSTFWGFLPIALWCMCPTRCQWAFPICMGHMPNGQGRQASDTNICSHDQETVGNFPEWILFWFSSPPAIDHVSHLESRYCCKDFWVVIGFLYFVSQPSLLPLVNFSSRSLWECGCGLMPFPGDPIISSSSHGQWSGLTCPGLIADTHPFQPTKILSLF